MGFWSSLLPALTTGAGFALGGPIGGMIGGTVGGGIAGADKQAEARKRQKATGAMRAAEQRYGYLNDRAPSTQIQYADSEMGDILGGAMSGGTTGLSLGQAGGQLFGGEGGPFKGLLAGGGGPTAGTPSLSGRQGGSAFGLGVDTGLGGGGSMYSQMLKKPSIYSDFGMGGGGGYG